MASLERTDTGVFLESVGRRGCMKATGTFVWVTHPALFGLELDLIYVVSDLRVWKKKYR